MLSKAKVYLHATCLRTVKLISTELSASNVCLIIHGHKQINNRGEHGLMFLREIKYKKYLKYTLFKFLQQRTHISTTFNMVYFELPTSLLTPKVILVVA